MAYQSLYRKYRPQTFDDVVGQGHVVRTLQNALTSGRIAHGFLFTGTRGTAKTTVARLLAKALNCQSGPGPVAEPCNACEACREITAGSCIDVVELDAASHRGVADIEEVRKAVGYGSMQYRYKVFIIDEAHQLSSDAKDAFLKTLEEPPPGVVFILATTEPQAIPITIRSRCQQFDFKRGTLADLTGRLKYVLKAENMAFTDDAVTLIARGAEGSYRDSLSLLEQVLAFEPATLDAEAVQTVLGTLGRETLGQVVQCVAERNAPEALSLAGQILDSGKEARSLLKALAAHFRDLMLVRVGGPAVAHELSPDEVGRLQDQAKRFSPSQLLKAIDILNEALGETRWNNQHRLLTELTFLKLMGLGDAGASDFQTAPIVFDAPRAVAPAAPAPKPVSAPPVAVARPEPPVERAPAPKPTAPPTRVAPEEDTLPPGFFASDDDETDDEDHFVPLSLDEEEAILAQPEDLADEPVVTEIADDEPALFEEPEVEPIAGALTGGASLPDPPFGVDPSSSPRREGEISPPLVPTESEIDRHPEGTRAGGSAEAPPYTLDDLYRAWPKFLAQAEKVSMRASVMMASAHPVAIEGKTIVLQFGAQAPFEMMSQPKQQEFVRKLLAMVLEAGETVPIRFERDPAADTLAMKFDRSVEKPLVRHDPLAKLKTLERADSAPSAPAYAPPAEREAPQAQERREAPPSRPAPEMRSAPARVETPAPVAAPNPWAVQHDALGAQREDPALTARREAALAEPLVQDALSIFGGEVVVE